MRRRGYNQSFAIIVGTGRVARKTAKALRHASWMGIKNIGYVEDRTTKFTSDLDILGTTADLPRLIEKYHVEHVFIALPMHRYNDARKVFDIVSQLLVEVRLVADVPTMAGLSLTTTNLDGLPVIGLRENPHLGLNLVVKRVMDVLISLVALILLSPVLLIISAVVKLTSRGPIFYSQERCGINGKTFRMLKFRSMRVDAESQTGAVWAVKDDPRRTRLGTFLRQTSLDELPQLINVLNGEMSLVGPRPLIIEEDRHIVGHGRRRLDITPGLTGLWQVMGRSDIPFAEMVTLDYLYVTNWSLWGDLKLLARTLPAVMRGRGAY
jgi:exopolysaccharide biosynthesis polyprenyl glycosylphosphotransferase